MYLNISDMLGFPKNLKLLAAALQKNDDVAHIPSCQELVEEGETVKCSCFSRDVGQCNREI